LNAYDIIGDIHGYADELEALLSKIGYVRRGSVWRHSERRAIFVGDLIDRGSKQLAVIDIVRRMVDAGSALAVMGNHEFNAIAYGSVDENGQPLRRHDAKNRRQHAAFLAAVEGRPPLYREMLDWFLSLPLWLELDDIHVIHACWHPATMTRFAHCLTPDRRLRPEFLIEAGKEPEGPDETLFHAVEIWLKGIEIPLPDGISYTDREGISRHKTRVRWWDETALRYCDAALLADELREKLPTNEIPHTARCRYESEKPLFFGHYWMEGTPRIQTPKIACVDFSVAKHVKLAAYRWNGEPHLSDAGFCFVEAWAHSNFNSGIST
jgi:hypothetical protein